MIVSVTVLNFVKNLSGINDFTLTFCTANFGTGYSATLSSFHII